MKDLGRDITAAARRDGKNSPLFENNLNNDLLVTFKRGLRWELKVRLNNVNTLDDARKEAIKLEREDGFNGNRDMPGSFGINKMRCCTLCDSADHETIDCDTLKRKNNEKVEKCGYCNSTSHKLANCITFVMDNNKCKQSEKCKFCDSSNHSTDNCIKFALIKKEKEPEVITINHIDTPTCSWCTEKGHIASNCNAFVNVIVNV